MKNFQNKKYFQYQPYYKGTLHTINNSSTVNNIYTNTSRNKIIRLNSAKKQVNFGQNPNPKFFNSTKK